jgi:hypothetical protein
MLCETDPSVQKIFFMSPLSLSWQTIVVDMKLRTKKGAVFAPVESLHQDHDLLPGLVSLEALQNGATTHAQNVLSLSLNETNSSYV